MSRAPFHLSLTVGDLDAAVDFYAMTLGCEVGRRGATWVDIDVFGHQLSLHLGPTPTGSTSEVDGIRVPMPHFGIVLDMPRWQALASRVEKAGGEFVIAPYSRFVGEQHEQATFFVADPAGNHLEFKGVLADQDLLADAPTAR